MLPFNVLIRYDSGQAGMTVHRRFSTFYETITSYFILLTSAFLQAEAGDLLYLPKYLDGHALDDVHYLFPVLKHVRRSEMSLERFQALPLLKDRDDVPIDDLRRQVCITAERLDVLFNVGFCRLEGSIFIPGKEPPLHL